MILQQTIDRVRTSSNIHDVIAKHVVLKKNGKSWIGCCPFHGEKTPSFHVNEDKGFYKCFGCGKSGDAVTFLQEHERLTFIDAIQQLADQQGIDVEYERKFTPEEIQAYKDKATQTEQALNFCCDYYHQQLMQAADNSEIWIELNQRGISRQMAVNWQMGYAPDDWDNVSSKLIGLELRAIALELGLSKEKSGKVYDKYRSRLILPSRDYRGQLNGFVGRIAGDKIKHKDAAKYINPADSHVYHKSEELFGLDKAKHAISDEGFAYIVEGNLDVVMMQENDVVNTICPGGTSLTPEQIRIMKRYTDVVCIMTDGDDAGEKAAIKWLDLLLQNDMSVKIIPLLDGQDPDTLIRTLKETTE